MRSHFMVRMFILKKCVVCPQTIRKCYTRSIQRNETNG